MYSLRIDDDLAARFDAVAARAGGRSALLRRLVTEAAAQTLAGPDPGPWRRRDGARVTVRLRPADVAAVDRAAAAMELSRAAWIAGLVGAHVAGRPGFAAGDHVALAGVARELRRIGVNVNQIARALNTAVMEGRVLDLELSSVSDFQLELRVHMLGLREAFAGNLAYWETAW